VGKSAAGSRKNQHRVNSVTRFCFVQRFPSKINDLQHEHWESGLDDIRDSFAHREWFDVPSREQGFVTHDVHRRPGSLPQSDRDIPELPIGAERKIAV